MKFTLLQVWDYKVPSVNQLGSLIAELLGEGLTSQAMHYMRYGLHAGKISNVESILYMCR